MAESARAGDAPIRTNGLTKRFRSGQVAVDHVDLTVPRGSVFGFLGPNGSGKTTTIRMLLGLIAPTSGSVSLLGEAMPKAQLDVLPRVGTLVEGPAFYPFWTGRANLVRFDQVDRSSDPATRSRRIDTALDRVGLSAASNKKVKAYSLGMKQRLGLAAALLQPRELLVLDEPTNGLDPQGTREVRTLVRELADEQTTVFLSTHLLSEVEHICTDVAVMSRGSLLRQSSVDELRAGLQPKLAITTPDPDAARAELEALELPVVATESGPHGSRDVVLVVTTDERPVYEIAAALVTADVRLNGFGLRRASLEDAFVALTGEGFDVAE